MENISELITNFGIIPAILIGIGYGGYKWLNRMFDENRERELRQEQQYKELLAESYKREDRYQDIIKSDLSEMRNGLNTVVTLVERIGGNKNHE